MTEIYNGKYTAVPALSWHVLVSYNCFKYCNILNVDTGSRNFIQLVGVMPYAFLVS